MTALTVHRATRTDLPLILQLFEQAIQYQKNHQHIGWKNFDRSFIESDIDHGLQYKITDGNHVLCIFSICYADPLIWRQREKNDAVYLHRIILNRAFQGIRVFQHVLAWATEHARERSLKFVRMDTWAANSKLIAYYQSYGFRFVEDYTTNDSLDLPLQHRNLHVALMERSV